MRRIQYIKHKIDNLINIKKIVTIHYQIMPERYNFEGEKHDFWELVFLNNNKLSYEIDGESIDLEENEVLFLSPNSFHSLKANKKSDVFIISFEFSSISMNYFAGKKICLEEEDIVILNKIISEAKSTFYLPSFEPELNRVIPLNKKSLGGEQILKNYLEIFLISLLRRETKSQISEHDFFSFESKIEKIIIKYLHSKIYGEISLDDLCLLTYYSKAYLCTAFKREMNASIYNFYMGLKLKEAKSLIKKGYSFSEISNMLCFDSLSHFTHTFIKYFGETPTMYKKRAI